MDDDFVKFGDQIMLFSDSSHGYLTTIGFSSPELFVQECSKIHLSHVPNLRNMIFEIVPKLGYDPMRELRREQKIMKQRELQEQINRGDNDADSKPELSPEILLLAKERFRMLYKRIQQQINSNDRWIKQNRGKKVLYGTPIQLKHVDSNMFIQYAKKTSTVDRECQQLELTQDPSAQRVTFQIQQRYKYRQDGEPVVFNDHIILYNQKFNCYIHASEEFKQEQVRQISKPSIYRPKSPVRRPNPKEVFKKMEANCSINFYKWQVINYRQIVVNTENKILYSGDVIRLKHAETNGYLCYDEISNRKPAKNVYVRIYRGLDDNDKITTNSLFEIEAHLSNRQQTTENQGHMLLWRQKGQAQTCQVRLRHINSGKLLTLKVHVKKDVGKKKAKVKRQLVLTLADCITSEEVNYRLSKIEEIEQRNKLNTNFNAHNDPEIQRLSQGVSPEQIFEIENSIVDIQNRVKNLSVVKIINKHYNVTISTEIKKLEGDEGIDEEVDPEAEEGQQNEDMTAIIDAILKNQESQVFRRLDSVQSEEEEQEIDVNKFTPMMYDESEFLIVNNSKLVKVGTMDDVYILEKVAKDEIESILVIQSCVPKIKEFSYNLRYNQNSLTSPYMKAFEMLLIQLVYFTINSESTDPFMCDGYPKKKHQKYLREIKVIDLLIDILIYPFEGENSFLDLSQLTQRSPMTRVCQLIYRLIKHYVKDNEFNKFYAAQWISHFFHQNMMTTDQNNLLAEETTNEILRGNKLLLDKQINSNVIRNIVETCARSQKNKRFLNLLCSLCSCNEEAISSNQDDICDLLLEEEDFTSILMKINTRQGLGMQKIHEVILTEDKNSDIPNKLEIEKLFDYFKQKGDLTMYYYFESMCKLVSLMCLQRNYKGIQILENMYTINFTIDCFLNSNLPYLLRANLAKILITLHIDKDPLEVLNIPILTRVWQEIPHSKLTVPQSRVPVPLKLLKIKDFFVEFFESQGGVQRCFTHEFNELMLQVLNMLEKMIKLGFYSNETELIRIINPIVELLDGSNDFTSKEEEDGYNAFQERQRQNALSKKKKMIEETFKRDKLLRYRYSENNVLIFAIKKKIIQILHYIQDIQNDIRLSKFLYEFYVSDGQIMINPSNAATKELNYLNMVLNNQELDEQAQEVKQKCDEKVMSWMRKSFANKTVDMKVKANKDIICILLDIILYQDSQMVNSGFTLLARYFSQKKSIIHYANDVQLLQDDEEVAILKKVSEELRDMKKDAENMEFWMGKTDKASLRKAAIFIQKLEMITDLCIDNPNRVIEIDDKKKKKKGEDHFGEEDEDDEDKYGYLNTSELLLEWDNEDPKVCDEDEKTDEKNQRLLKNLNAHMVPIIIIRQQSLEQADDKNSYLRVLEKAYIFLIKFVRNNKTNQKVLVEYLDLFLDDMEFGVHSWELICEIFKNSDQLTTFNLVPLIKKSIKIIDNLPKETQKKTILLSFLKYFMQNANIPVRENQYLICSEITSSIRKNSDHLFVGEQGLKDLHLYMLEMKNSYQEFMGDERFLQEIVIPPELCYTMEYISLLAESGLGKNSATEAIASDKLPLYDLIKNMEMADFCYPLKSSLVYFMDSIYFEVEKDVSDENIQKMQKVIQIIYIDIEKFLEIQQRVKTQKGGTMTTTVKKANVTDIDDNDLENVFVDINKNFNMLTAFGSFPIVQLMEKYIFDHVFPALIHFLNLRLPIKPNQKEFYKKLFVILQKSVTFAKKDSHFENSKNLFKTIKRIPQLKEFGGDNMSNKMLTQYLLKGDDSKKTQTGLGMMMGLPNLSSAQKLSAYLQSVSVSDTLIDDFEKEFEHIVQYVINIKSKTEKAFNGTNTLDVKELIHSLITVSDIDSDIEQNLRIICLKVMRKVIEMENKNSTQPSSTWEADDWSLFEHEVQQKQDMLIELGVIKLLCNLIAFEGKRAIKEEALLVGIACLLGGNMGSQMKFFEYIQKDLPNQFLVSLKEMLFEAIEYMKHSQTKRNQLKMKLIQVTKRIAELKQIDPPTKLSKQELMKCTEQKRVLEDDVAMTESNPNENPATYTTNNLTVKRSIDNCMVILRFLQLLCENHNPNLQNFLRQQCHEDGKPKSNSFDMCSYLSKCLEQFQNLLNDQTFDVCNQLVSTLVESIQGPCKANQRALVESKVIDSSREFIAGFEKESDLIHIGFESEEDIDSMGEFKYKIVTLLTSLLEGEVDMEIINRMAFSLDFNMMKDRLLTVFKRFVEKLLNKNNVVIKDLALSVLDNRLQKDSFDDSVQEAFEIYILIHTLADSNVAQEHLTRDSFNADQWKAFEYIRSHTGRIEINVNNQLQRIYFPIRPVCGFISPAAKEQLMVNVDRESQGTKVRDLIQAVPGLIDEMKQNEELQRATLKITPKRLRDLKDFSTVVGIIMNIIFLFSRRKYHYREPDIDDWIIDSIEVLGYIQGTSSLILIFFFIINKKELITKKKWREYIQANQGKYELIPNEDRLEINEMSIEMTHLILMLKGPTSPEFNLGPKPNFGNFFTWSEYKILTFYFFIQDPTFQYFVLYFGISMLGKQSSSIYYSFHLLDVINRSVILQNVMKAITQNIYQTGLTFLLMMILIYIYCSFTFFYLQDGMWDYGINAYDSDVVGENNCQSMFQCYISMVDKGMRKGGGIGDSTVPVYYNEKEKYLFKLVHDSSYQIVINIICLNIIFGIIVNSFATLRDQKKKNDEDMHNVCYICNFERLIFDKDSEGGFDRHIQADHNLWQYVFYIVHLNTKDSSDYTGIESYVTDKLNEQDYTWIPRQKALCLQNSQDQDEEEMKAIQLQTDLNDWQSRIKMCTKYLEEIQKKIDKNEKAKEEAIKQTMRLKKRALGL